MALMGRHVVITFDDPAQAAAFVAAVQVEGAVFYQGEDTHFKNIDLNTTRIAGVFVKPNDFCQCKYVRDMDYVRGSKYGLYVHNYCKKPAGGHLQNATWNLFEEPEVINGVKRHRVHLSVREGQTRWPEPKEKS